MFKEKNFLMEKLGIGARTREDTLIILGNLYDEIYKEGVTDKIIGEYLFIREYLNKYRSELLGGKNYSILAPSTFIDRCNLILDISGKKLIDKEEKEKIIERIKEGCIKVVKIEVVVKEQEVIDGFEGAVNSDSYRIIRDAVIEHKEEWLAYKWYKQEDLGSYIYNNYNGITVQFQTVCSYVSDVLDRLGIAKRYRKMTCENGVPYEEEELRELLDDDDLSLRIIESMLRNVKVCGWSDDLWDIVQMNRNLLGEERYKKCMALDANRLRVC